MTAARKYGRAAQHGTQQRTIEMNRFACEFVRDGAVFVGEDCKIEINRNKFSTNPPDFIKNSPDPKLAKKWEGDGWVAKGHVETCSTASARARSPTPTSRSATARRRSVSCW